LRRPRYLAIGALALGAAFAVTTESGCGPVEYLSQVTGRASRAVQAAKEAEAPKYAVYEYTAAEAYLEKAREEAGFAQYEQAIAYGRRAEELALRAQAKSRAAMGAAAESGDSAGGNPEAPTGADATAGEPKGPGAGQ